MLTRDEGIVIRADRNYERRLYFSRDQGAWIVDWQQGPVEWAKISAIRLGESDLSVLYAVLHMKKTGSEEAVTDAVLTAMVSTSP